MYLLKPWDNNTLVQEVEQLFRIQNLLKDRKLLDKINELEDLPTLPELYQDICRMIEGDTDIRKITQAIEVDQVVAAKVLRIANSAFCGVNTGSLQQAVAYLGLDAIKNILLSCMVFEPKAGADSRAKVVQTLLWRHANATNKLMQLFSEELLHKRLAEDRISVGLVHNIGKVVLLHQYGGRYVDAFLRAEQSGTGIDAIELEEFALSHQEVGAYLLNWWNLPYPFVEAAMHHHDPLAAPSANQELLLLLHLANYYAWRKIRPAAKVVLREGVLEVLGAQRDACERIMKEMVIS